MTFKPDITQRINTDFGETADEATKKLLEAITKTEYLKADRVIRCIIYLAKGNLTDLNNYIESATNDTRHVMLWAEYTGITESKTPKRVRDFNKTFDKCSQHVQE